MDVLRTPDEAFAKIQDFPFVPNYVDVDGLRMHYVDDGPSDGATVLMLHGEPSWSYLYRKMIPVFTNSGYRAIAPDLIGFGKSDKPAEQSAYSYQAHVDWVRTWIAALGLNNITLICQDWGSLIGLRIAGENPELFSRVVLSNGFLPTGEERVPKAFKMWQEFSQTTPVFDVGAIVDMGTTSTLTEEIKAAYNAPFPDESYKAGARIFPKLVPTSPDNPASPANKAAWETFKNFNKPFLTAFSDKDPITRGGDKPFQKLVPGARNQPHTIIEGAGHFIQEDNGEELAQYIVDWMSS